MARIRTIKPEFWTDEKVVALSFAARLLFLGLLNFADDEGRMAYSFMRLKMQIFPNDEIDILPLVKELWITTKMVAIYEVDGSKYLQVNNFRRHQKNEKHTPSKFPAPKSGNPPLEAEISTGKEWKGKEGNRKGKKQNPSVAVAPVDERKSVVREAIKKGYCWANKTQDCPWGPAEEVALNAMFIDVPKSFTAEMLVDCVRNRFLSEDVRSDPPRKWIRMILTWKEAPLDRFGKPKTQGNGNGKNGKPNKATERFNSNVEAIAEGFGLRNRNRDDPHDSELAELQCVAGNGRSLEGRVASDERPIRIIDAPGDRDPVHSGAKGISADPRDDS